MKKTFGQLSGPQKEAIILTEIHVMLPILHAIDLPVTAEGLRASIERDPAQTVIAVTDGPAEAPLAWVRFTAGEPTLFVKSIQLGSYPLHLRPLLREIVPALREEKADTVVSVVQGGNDASLSLHRKLGFRIEKELPRATRFVTGRKELLARIEALTGLATN